jgi:hypothetical protein
MCFQQSWVPDVVDAPNVIVPAVALLVGEVLSVVNVVEFLLWL